MSRAEGFSVPCYNAVLLPDGVQIWVGANVFQSVRLDAPLRAVELVHHVLLGGVIDVFHFALVLLRGYLKSNILNMQIRYTFRSPMKHANKTVNNISCTAIAAMLAR